MGFFLYVLSLKTEVNNNKQQQATTKVRSQHVRSRERVRTRSHACERAAGEHPCPHIGTSRTTGYNCQGMLVSAAHPASGAATPQSFSEVEDAALLQLCSNPDNWTRNLTASTQLDWKKIEPAFAVLTSTYRTRASLRGRWSRLQENKMRGEALATSMEEI